MSLGGDMSEEERRAFAEASMAWAKEYILTPEMVAATVFEGVRRGRFYILADNEYPFGADGFARATQRAAGIVAGIGPGSSGNFLLTPMDNLDYIKADVQ